MEIKSTPFSSVYLITPSIFPDNRGHFFESYNDKKLSEIGLDKITFVQDNESLSKKGVLRGLHFQKPPFAQDKLVRVIKGAVLDVIVDLRKDSKTYGKHISFELNDRNKLMLFVPKGFAHGFVTLEDETIFNYKCSDYYNKESESGIRWNDDFLNIVWGVEDPIVNEKDQVLPLFKELESIFE